MTAKTKERILKWWPVIVLVIGLALSAAVAYAAACSTTAVQDERLKRVEVDVVEIRANIVTELKDANRRLGRVEKGVSWIKGRLGAKESDNETCMDYVANDWAAEWLFLVRSDANHPG